MALKLTILGDWHGAKEALKATRNYAQKTAKSIKSVFGGVLGNVLSPLGLGLSTAGLATAVGAIVGELDKIGKAADNLGVTTDYFQRLEYAAQRTNTPIEQVAEALGKVKRMAAEALNGNAQASDLFSRLGIGVEELRRLRPEELFDRVNQAMRNVTDARDRDFIASKLYGESFQKLNNFLRDYVALGNEYANSGKLIDEADIRAAEALDDAITDLKKSLTSLVVNSGFVKWLSDIASAMIEITGLAGKDRDLAKKGFYNRSTAVKEAIDRAEESGSYSSTEIEMMRRASKQYADREIARDSMAADLLDQAMKEAGFGKMARQKFGFVTAEGMWEGSADSIDLRADPTHRARVGEIVEQLGGRGQLTGSEAERIYNAGSLEQLEKVSRDIQRERKLKDLEKRKGELDGNGQPAAPAVIDPYVSRLEREFKFEQLKRKKGDREAWIERELDSIRGDYKRRGETLTEEEEARQRGIAGDLYDLRNPAKAAAVPGEPIQPEAERITADAMTRIGAYNGFQRTSADNQLQYARNSATATESIDRKLDRVITAIDPETKSGQLTVP